MKAKAVQLAGWTDGASMAAHALPQWLDRVLAEEPADLVVFSELALSPYFPTSTERSWLQRGLSADDVAEDFGKVAKKHDSHLVVPFAESSGGVLYNSVLMIAPDGALRDCKVVAGPSIGERRPAYRKTHLSENRNADPGVHEKYYFAPGDGLVIWETAFGVIAPLICYDRSFPEAWRVLSDAGASVVVVPIATSRRERVEMLERELTVAACQNGVFVIAACKAGDERLDGKVITYSGSSMLIDPFGEVISSALPTEGDITISSRFDLGRLDEWNQRFHYRRDRRNDLYRTEKKV